MSAKTVITEEAKKAAVFNAKNYRNSPVIRDFYRFIAKNGLRAESHRLLESASNRVKKRATYLSNLNL